MPVLQDWFGAAVLARGVDPDVQRLGRSPRLKTNRYLEALLQRVFNRGIAEVYVTNAFPYIKPGGMSAAVPKRLLRDAVAQFTKAELALAQPEIVLGLGASVADALQSSDVECICLPHPAARIGNVASHERVWRERIPLTHMQAQREPGSS